MIQGKIHPRGNKGLSLLSKLTKVLTEQRISKPVVGSHIEDSNECQERKFWEEMCLCSFGNLLITSLIVVN